jgi:hypothetical protein
MPRKKVVPDEKKVENKKTIEEKLQNNNSTENLIIKLPLTNELINNEIEEQIENIYDEKYDKYNICPKAYDPNELYVELNTNQNINLSSLCLWCRYNVNEFRCGLPISYNNKSKHYNLYGNFCSFECASAYNFSKNSKSDKVWEINIMINKLAESYGFNIPIRPAPDYELLDIFVGNMTIEEFRNAHKTSERSYTLNIPPQSYVNSTVEVLNTSYINSKSNKKVGIEKMI